MNIIKSKKPIATILAFVMVMALAQSTLPAAKERRGSTVVVTMTDGSLVKGELLAVKNNALLLYDSDADQGTSLDLGQVTQVKLLKKSKTLKGITIGFSVGLVLIFSSRLKFPNSGKDKQLNNLGFPFISGLCGGLMGLLVGMPEKFFLAGESLHIAQKNLMYLKRYAREQDLEKPAGTN